MIVALTETLGGFWASGCCKNVVIVGSLEAFEKAKPHCRFNT